MNRGLTGSDILLNLLQRRSFDHVANCRGRVGGCFRRLTGIDQEGKAGFPQGQGLRQALERREAAIAKSLLEVNF
jgi:hypothetical protein